MTAEIRSALDAGCCTFQLRHFPIEIYRLIICDATCVPGALNTSYEFIVQEDRESIQAAIATSLVVKCSLCLVSKTFYHLTKEYLYEIITFRRFNHIPRVVEFLRTSRNGKLPGMWCRRLDLCLGRDNNDYAGEDWEGSDILWGLIPACPNVTVLMFHGYYITYNLRMTTKRGLTGPLVPSVKLWKLMATIWASSLRRIEMSGIWIRSDRFEKFIRYFTHLQACRITTIELFDPSSQSFDGNEPPTDNLAKNFLRRVGRFPAEIRYMDTDTTSLLRHHQKTATWPPYEGDQPYKLPSLHTLHLDNFPDLLSHFHLPNVRFLGAYDLCEPMPRNAFHSVLVHVSSAFSSSLTRFTCGSESTIDFIRIFDAFPHLTDLKVLVHSALHTPSRLFKPLHPQRTLKHLRIVELSKDRLGGISEILSVVRSGIFSELENISVICQDERLHEVRASVHSYGLASLGVSVQVSSGMVSIRAILPRFPVYP